ncbi:TLD-domain-containing protein, partial [Aureobasidium melanogenum]
MQHSSNPASPTRSRSPSPPLRDSSSSVTDTRDTSPSPDNKDAPFRKDSGSDKNEATFFQHITYPVSYTFSGLLRRLSADEAPTPLARALSANYNGAMGPSAAFFDTPKRRLSPFQPPPLTPLTLVGYKDGTPLASRLLEKALAEEIRLLVPPRVQLVDEWKLVYSLEQNGTSLGSLYSLSDHYRGKRGGFVLVVRDASQGVFGAYLSDPPQPHPHYYGTGECFLWSAFRLPSLPDLSSLPPPPSADTTHMQRSTTIASTTKKPSLTPSSTSGTSTPDRIRFKAFPYTGENDYTMFCQQGFLSVGGGDGHYGLWLDNNLARGISSPCPTFGNARLSDEGEKFGILGVELWYIGS